MNKHFKSHALISMKHKEGLWPLIVYILTIKRDNGNETMVHTPLSAENLSKTVNRIHRVCREQFTWQYGNFYPPAVHKLKRDNAIFQNWPVLNCYVRLRYLKQHLSGDRRRSYVLYCLLNRFWFTGCGHKQSSIPGIFAHED